MSTVITSIDPHSPAEKAGIVVGEQLLEINGHHIVDVLDYRFFLLPFHLDYSKAIAQFASAYALFARF